MPTILTHAVIPLAIGTGLGRDVIPGRLLAAGVVAALLPDLDVLAFHAGIPYGAAFGHRGFSHSLFFAAVIALLGAGGFRVLRARFLTAFLFLFVAAASHGILDAFTNGGLGIAFFWPWSAERYFAPAPVIEVAPLSIARFFSARGWAVLQSELGWVWLPGALLSAALAGYRVCLARAALKRPADPGAGDPLNPRYGKQHTTL